MTPPVRFLPCYPMTHANSSHILIVDDTPTNLQVLATTLTEAGFEVAVAIDGAMALEQAHLDLPDLILLDVLMPELDGFATCLQLKANPKTRDIPVIFMTALSNTADKVKGLSLGAVDYIAKPYQAEEVLARVRVHLHLQALTRSLEQKNQELALALTQLQSAQQQIIRQEKLAAIGALTAGVTHELRNPLNFVNNYAEGSIELLDELCQELAQCSQQMHLDRWNTIKALLDDVRQNTRSIHRHGERATSVIQSMLIQTRNQQMMPQPTDLNALLDQAVKLAYHSKRSQYDNFSAILNLDYDPQLPPQSVVAADLSRAFINLIDNACYALYQKQLTIDFIPTLSVMTRLQEQSVEICIRDNGVGIPAQVQRTLFEPFFTTKPLAEGTGLGLTLAQETIIQHHGELSCRTEAGLYTEFTIRFPLQPVAIALH